MQHINKITELRCKEAVCGLDKRLLDRTQQISRTEIWQ